MGSSLKQLLSSLSQWIAPSGGEADLLSHLKTLVTPYCDRIEQDALGNLLAFREGTDPHLPPLLLCAHTDEVGFLIRALCEDGSLAFSCVGGINESILCGKSVTILGKNGPIHGVIFEKPLHLLSRSEREKMPKTEDFRMDIGAKDKQTAQELVDIGNFAVMDGDFVPFGRSLCKGKALDDRLGCAILCEVLRTLFEKGLRTPYPLYVAFTVREEIGLSGSLVAANRIAPSHALVLETTAIADLPHVPAQKQVAQVGCGGVLSIADRSTVYDRNFVQSLFDLAKEQHIPVQVKKYLSGGNDAGHIHKSRAGVKCAALSAPCRYLHSPACVLDLKDAEAMFDLVMALLQSEKTIIQSEGI